MTEISRRVTLAWIAAASAYAGSARAQDAAQPSTWPDAAPPPISAAGYGQDPDIVAAKVPWPLTLDPHQREALRIAADLMLPADAHSPSGGSLKLDAFIDEWVSAPYPQQARDREILLPGLAWLDTECRRRFQADFVQATDAQRRVVFDAIAWRDRVQPGYQRPARFFARLRALMLAGFYSLPEGLTDIGYLGNVPSSEPYPGPPPEAKAHFQAAMAKLGLKTV